VVYENNAGPPCNPPNFDAYPNRNSFPSKTYAQAYSEYLKCQSDWDARQDTSKGNSKLITPVHSNTWIPTRSSRTANCRRGGPSIRKNDSRTAAKLCRAKGGELEQIQFLLGHESILTTERYLGSEQDLKNAVNDALVFE
jgi:hypothetical protein